MKYVINYDNNLPFGCVLNKFSTHESAQDSFIDSSINELSIFISKKVKIDVKLIEFSDLLFENTFIDIISESSNNREVLSINFQKFSEDRDNDMEDYLKRLKEFRDNLLSTYGFKNNPSTSDINLLFKINVRFEINTPIKEIRLLLKRNEDELYEKLSFISNLSLNKMQTLLFDESYLKHFNDPEKDIVDPHIGLFFNLSDGILPSDFNFELFKEWANIKCKHIKEDIFKDSTYKTIIFYENRFEVSENQFEILIILPNEDIKLLKKNKVFNEGWCYRHKLDQKEIK